MKISEDEKNWKWELLTSRNVLSAAPWVNVYIDNIRLPSGRVVDDFYRIELPEHVMVYAHKKDGSVLME